MRPLVSSSHSITLYFTTPHQYVILECFNRGSAEIVKSLFSSERTSEFLIGFDWGPVMDKFFFVLRTKNKFIHATPIFYIKNKRVLALFIKTTATAETTSSFAFIK